MAALLSSEIDDGNKRDMMVDHIADARKLGVEVLPPDVNRGEADFTVARRPDRLRPDRHQGARPRGRRGDRPGPRGRRGRSRTCSTSASGSTTKIVTEGGHRAAHQGRGVRRVRQPFAHRAQLLAALPSAIQAAEEQQEDRTPRPAQLLRPDRRRDGESPTGPATPRADAAARRPAVAEHGEAQVREGGARLLLLQPPARPVRRGPASGSPRTPATMVNDARSRSRRSASAACSRRCGS